MNTRSSTEAELVAVDDVIAQILWTLCEHSLGVQSMMDDCG